MNGIFLCWSHKMVWPKKTHFQTIKQCLLMGLGNCIAGFKQSKKSWLRQSNLQTTELFTPIPSHSIFPWSHYSKSFFYKIAINLSPLLKKYKTRLKKKQANKRPFRTRSKPRLENSKFKQRPTQAMQTFPQKRRFSQGTAHFSWLQSQWDHPGLSPCHGILLSAPVIRRGDWRVIPSRETRKVISHQTGYARKSWTQ